MSITTPPENNRLDAYLNGVEHLPPAPMLMIKLIDLCRQPERDIDEIASLMRQDPSLTAEVLRRCNGSFFDNDEPVTDFNEALFRLGFYEVYRISVAMFALKSAAVARKVRGFEVEELWEHSAVTAIIAGSFARELEESEGVAFTAGLLHDIGKMVMASAEGTQYGELMLQHESHGLELDQAERARYGFSHAEIGARLLERWGVPEAVVQPVRMHHQAKWSGPDSRMAAIVSLANLIANCPERANSEHVCKNPGILPAIELLGFSQDKLQELRLAANVEMKHLGSLLAK